MNEVSFWDSYVAKVVEPSRFGTIALGCSTVQVIDVKIMKASQNFHLDDNGLITGIEVKPNYPVAFDQEIAVLVYSDDEGRKLIDRRSAFGWLTCTEKDENKNLKATPALIQAHGLVAVGNRFTKNGVGVKSQSKTKTCVDFMDRLCSAAEVDHPMKTKGKMLDIWVEAGEYEGKANREAKAYAKAGTGFPTKLPGNATATVKETVKPTVPIINITQVQDDLPF